MELDKDQLVTLVDKLKDTRLSLSDKKPNADLKLLKVETAEFPSNTKVLIQTSNGSKYWVIHRSRLPAETESVDTTQKPEASKEKQAEEDRKEVLGLLEALGSEYLSDKN